MLNNLFSKFFLLFVVTLGFVYWDGVQFQKTLTQPLKNSNQLFILFIRQKTILFAGMDVLGFVRPFEILYFKCN